MQRVVSQAKTSARACGNRQLFVSMLEVRLAGLNQTSRRHLAAHDGPGAVGGEHGLHRHRDRAIALEIMDARGLRIEIGRFEPVLEVKSDPLARAGDLDQRSIEQMSGNGVNDLVWPLSV